MSMLDPDTQQAWKIAAEKAAAEQALVSLAEKPDPLNDELQVMRSIVRAVEKLPRPAQVRVLDYVRSRFVDTYERELNTAMGRLSGLGRAGER